MTLADEMVVRTTLGKYETVLSQAAFDAWVDWKALLLGGRLLFPARSRACLVYDFLAGRLLTALSDDASVHTVQKNETVKLLFGGQVLLRCKKANDRGLGSNIATQATLDFVEQQQELPGLPDMHKVELVYVLNRFQTQIDRVEIVARDGDTCLWSYALAPTATCTAIPLPLAPVADADRGARVRVKATGEGQKKEAGE